MKHNANEFLHAFHSKQRDLPVPTCLPVTIEGKPANLAMLSILRLLPGKRVVLRASFDNKSIAVKFFVKNRSSARHIKRERAGYERVRMAGLLCPKLIGHCISSCGLYEGLIYDFISDATELVQCWRQFDTPQKCHWLRRVVAATLQLHQRAGAYQQDIHLGNFLIKNDQLYLLDLGSIVIRSAPLPQAQCLANLGQLIAQLDVGEQALLDAPIEHYFSQCGWRDTATLKNNLHNAVRSAWRYRLRDYLGKAQRDCSLTGFEQTFNRVFAFRRDWQSDDLQRFARDPDRFMVAGELLKSGNTATVAKATIDGKSVVIKRYNIKNWRHALSRSIRATRAEHSWRFAHLLEIAGIDSLKPIALLERRCGPLRSKAYFVSGWIEAPDLLAVGAQRALSAAELDALQALLEQMVKCRLSHGDFKANNLLLDRERIAVIDLDAMQRHTQSERFWRYFDKDLARLQRNWPTEAVVFNQVQVIIAKLLTLQKQQDFYL